MYVGNTHSYSRKDSGCVSIGGTFPKHCIDNYIANSGMYIGYARYLNEIFDHALGMKCNDDQVNINRLCNKYSYVSFTIEHPRIVFE